MASELSLKTPSTGLVTLSPADTATDKTITLPATTGTMVVQDATNTTTINNLAYTGTLTGGTGVVNIGSGQLVKDVSGNLGVGSSPQSGAKLTVRSGTSTLHTILGNNFGSLHLDTASGGPNRITSLNAGLSAGQALAFNGGGGAEWARFTTNGNLLIGSTSDAFNARQYINFNGSGTSNTGIALRGNGGSGQQFMEFVNSGGGGTGSITQSAGGGTNYNTSSDYRLKENVRPLSGALDRIVQLKPSEWDWKADGSAGQGFIAHELQAVVPDCVTGEKDAVDAEGKPQYQGVDTSFLVATLVSAIQELTARLEVLENK